MTAIANAVIEKVYPGTEGESEHGPWRAYNFTIEGSDLKFGYFWGEGKSVPREGMILEVLQYTTKQNGKYTNHTVKKLEVAGNTNPVQASEHQKGVKGAPTASERPRTAPVAIRTDVKSVTIGMYACVKATDHSKLVSERIKDAIYLFKSVADFAEEYRRDLDKIQEKMDENKVPPEFWDWLIGVNGVLDTNDLTQEATAYTLKEFPVVVKRYVDSTKPVKEEIPQQDEDTIREQTFAEALIPGPEDTSYPGNVTPEYPADEKCPEPSKEEECPW